MSLDTLTVEDAAKLLTLPRVVGIDPTAEDRKAAEITAQNGRYGPYIKRGADSRSLDSEEQLFTVTLDEALAIFAQPKLRGRRAAAAPPLKELGVDPVSQKPMVVKDGRFGPYVTDGETNASLRRDDSVEALTDERASELLADRRARGPVKKAAKRTAQEGAGQEGRREEDAGEEGGREGRWRRRRAKKTAKAAAKKAPAQAGAEGRLARAAAPTIRRRPGRAVRHTGARGGPISPNAAVRLGRPGSAAFESASGRCSACGCTARPA